LAFAADFGRMTDNSEVIGQFPGCRLTKWNLTIEPMIAPLQWIRGWVYVIGRLGRQNGNHGL